MKKVAVFALAAMALACAPAFAQRPDGAPRFGGIRGMMNGPIAMGTVTQIDRARNAVQIQMMGPEATNRWVTVSQQTTMSRQAQGTLADLKPNDTIVVSGVPTAMNASQIQVGEMPTPFGLGGGFGRGGPGGPPGGGAPPPGGQMPGLQSTARATGKVVSTRPLVVSLQGNITLNVVADPSTQITKVVTATLADVKVGDSILAVGQPDESGNLAASQVQIGVDLRGGFGFGGGGFRFGGPGGPGGDRPRERTP